MQNIPKDLVEQIAAGAGSVFVGAGASIAAGLPSWAQLVEPLRAEIPDCPHSVSFVDVAQFYENEFGRTRLTEKIRQRLEESAQEPTALHLSLIGLLRAGRIYTTNYDGLIEAAAKTNGLRFRRIVNTDPQVSFDRDRLNIIKLHGDLEQPKSYVITAQDYESYFRKNPGLTRLITTEFQTGTVLFIGYSHNDLDLRMMLRRITDENGRFSRSHYTVQVNPRNPVVKDLQRRGLRVISIQSDQDAASRNEAVSEWLRDLHQKIREFSGATGVAVDKGAIPNHNFPAAAHRRLLGRQKDSEAVSDALARPEVSMISISGFTGVGKTALAYDVGMAALSPHSLVPKFDYGIWVSANKPDQKLWLDEVMNTLAITMTGERLPENREAYRRDKYQLVRGKKVLIVINNYELIDDDELADWIKNLPEPTKVIVTTRRVQSLQTPRCWHVQLGGLAKAEAMEFARDHARSLGFLNFLQERDIESLSDVSGGNPQVIKLALGLVGGGTTSLPDVVEQLRGIADRRVHDNLLEKLFAWSWTLLSDDAKKLLMITTLFVGTSISRLEALYEVSRIEQGDFDRALDQLLEFRLLEPTHDGRFVTHSMTRAFARRNLDSRPELGKSGKKACVTYFLKFAKEKITRDEPPVPYWGALVSDRMRDIDPEWSCVQAAMGWASDDELVDFVMLLAHYLDSRFLNAERIDCVTRALSTLVRSGRKTEEALLRIDALSWTLVEADQLRQALGEIVKGLEIANEFVEGHDKVDLNALGFAWKARVMVELGESLEVTDLISTAMSLPCSPWIMHRVNMAAGDVAMKQRRFNDAYEHYQRCGTEVRKYGGEGHDYQIAPRLGFACIGLQKLDEAKRHFEELRNFGPITVGHMYAEYGLALVAHANGELDIARELLEHLRAQILSRARSSLLLKLIDEVSAPLGRAASNKQ